MFAYITENNYLCSGDNSPHELQLETDAEMYIQKKRAATNSCDSKETSHFPKLVLSLIASCFFQHEKVANS